MTASPISDLNPVFLAAGCKVTLMDKGRTVPLDSSLLKPFTVPYKDAALMLHTDTQSCPDVAMSLGVYCSQEAGLKRPLIKGPNGTFSACKQAVM